MYNIYNNHYNSYNGSGSNARQWLQQVRGGGISCPCIKENHVYYEPGLSHRIMIMLYHSLKIHTNKPW